MTGSGFLVKGALQLLQPVLHSISTVWLFSHEDFLCAFESSKAHFMGVLFVVKRLLLILILMERPSPRMQSEFHVKE